ncbi:DUF6283 family protein [Glycomyces sp. A-F 0318]|uniref:DUF6283 family protein n=1 Tax=Glycomyces amatae TaxID=2881355 RepID=UPI001E657444|nr:DUF6283 family protein [Glycomyces amatae]MCD0446399.1 DUF6283 family protein [Glycomyces amatae]
MNDKRELPRQKRPCTECPWQTAAEPGKFPPERFEALKNTSEQPENWDGAPQALFACHMVPERPEQDAVACAGWLATCGGQNFSVRLAVAFDQLPAEALQPGADWPELYESYDAMAEANEATDAEGMRRP